MLRIGGLVAGVAAALWLGGCGGATGGEADAKQADSRAAIVSADLGNDFSGNYLWVHGRRSDLVDAKYPCLNEATACLALDAEGRSTVLKDLCPSIDTPEGTWSFEYALYTDDQCSQALGNVRCVIAEGETLAPGANHNNVECLTENAQKDFEVCLYDPVTRAGIGHCLYTVLVFHDYLRTYAKDAAQALGYEVIYTEGTATDPSQFDDAFDAGGFQLIIWDSPMYRMPITSKARLLDWLDRGGLLIFSYWDLDTDPELQAALGVSVLESYWTWRDVYPATESPVNLFTLLRQVPVPLQGIDAVADDGDTLALLPVAPGFVAGRLDSADGPGAIAVTRGNRVIVNGFLPFDVQTLDADGDGAPDMQELYENEIKFLASH